RGEATWDEALLLFLERSGFPEETYHTFSYSPLYDDASRVTGMLCVVTEVTEREIGERRLRVLRDLAAPDVAANGEGRSVAGSCERTCRVLAQNPADVSFAALYLFDAQTQTARRAARSSAQTEAALPLTLSLAAGASPWPVAALLATETSQALADLPQRGIQIAAQPWPDLVQDALVLPLKGATGLAGFLVAGASPRLPLDDKYRDFLDLVAGQISAALADAQAYEAERQRAQALAEIDRAKTVFFSNVSHEFRTPLTLMLGPLQEMADAPETPPTQRARLDLAHRNALRLLKLVNSLLDFSRVEAGREK
ncbi:double histidine kinase dhkd, putative, partial [Ricinus communis]